MPKYWTPCHWKFGNSSPSIPFLAHKDHYAGLMFARTALLPLWFLFYETSIYDWYVLS